MFSSFFEPDVLPDTKHQNFGNCLNPKHLLVRNLLWLRWKGSDGERSTNYGGKGRKG